MVEPQDILSASATSVPACARDLEVLCGAGRSACRLSPRLADPFTDQERGFGLLRLSSGREWPLARMSGAQKEPQAGTCGVLVQLPSRLGGTAWPTQHSPPCMGPFPPTVPRSVRDSQRPPLPAH